MAMPDRKRNRLEGYDYSRPGIYFITICAREKRCLFGEIPVGDGPRAVPYKRMDPQMDLSFEALVQPGAGGEAVAEILSRPHCQRSDRLSEDLGVYRHQSRPLAAGPLLQG